MDMNGKKGPCCDSEECKAYKKRSVIKYPLCLHKRREYKRRQKSKKKRQIISYLGGECVDCGMKAAVVDKVTKVGNETFAPNHVFDVEHVKWRKKTFKISNGYSFSWERIKKELDDCECVLLCRICHAIRTKELNKDKQFKRRNIDAQVKSWYSKSPQPLNSTSA